MVSYMQLQGNLSVLYILLPGPTMQGFRQLCTVHYISITSAAERTYKHKIYSTRGIPKALIAHSEEPTYSWHSMISIDPHHLMSFSSSSSLAGDICPESSYHDPSDRERLTQVEGHDQDEYTPTHQSVRSTPWLCHLPPHFIHFHYHVTSQLPRLRCSL